MAPPSYETRYICVSACIAAGSESPVPVPVPVVTVDVTAASELITSAGHRYVDVRTQEEMSKGHLHNSLNVPFVFLAPQGREKNPMFVEQLSLLVNKEEHVVVGCQSGKRSELACVDLLEAGFKNVKNMGGGYAAWLDCGFPVNTRTM